MTTPAAAPPVPEVSPYRREFILYAGTIFLSAYLLFQVQLIIAKFILPWFGGAPAVWTTCMLVFQFLLLAGYAYAHRLQQTVRQEKLHLGLLAASVLLLAVLALVWKTPILPGAWWKPHSVDRPAGQIIELLLVAIGLPFLVLSTTGPLLQKWFFRGGVSPYRLYAVSNLGSMLGLLAYPFLVEPALTLHSQAWMWSGGYVLFAAGVLLCARARKGVPGDRAPEAAAPGAEDISIVRRLGWFLLPACASAALLAVTNLICQDVAVISFLWVVPLCLYLLSFIICFDSPRWYRRAIFHPLYGVAVFAALAALFFYQALSAPMQIVVHCVAMFAVAMGCHGELFRLRPGQAHLTSFYLTLAAGGALGGFFVAIVAPRIFVGYWEYHAVMATTGLLLLLVVLADRDSWLHESYGWLAPLMLTGALLLPYLAAVTLYAPAVGQLRHSRFYFPALTLSLLLTLWAVVRTRDSAPHRRWARGAQVCAAVFLLALGWGFVAQTRGSNAISRSRNFFGTLAVIPNGDHTLLGLRHGRTLHGFQFVDPAKRGIPTGYYAVDSGIGLVLNTREQWAGRPIRIGAIGLGVGTIATYALPGDYLHFYEINQQVVNYSEGDQPIFWFLRNSRGRVDVSVGDGRLCLEQEADRGQYGKFDVMVVDAFSSDSIPVHLLTRESLQLYRRHLRGPDSLLLFHISNGTLDLRPVLLGLAQEEHLALKRVFRQGQSDWVLLSANPALLKIPALAAVPDAPMSDRPAVYWTDQFSDLAVLVKWRAVLLAK